MQWHDVIYFDRLNIYVNGYEVCVSWTWQADTEETAPRKSLEGVCMHQLGFGLSSTQNSWGIYYKELVPAISAPWATWFTQPHVFSCFLFHQRYVVYCRDEDYEMDDADMILELQLISIMHTLSFLHES